MATKNSAKEIVKAYLDRRAAEDPQFAQSYAKTNKNLDECWQYILGEAKKRAVGGACCISDDEVFGLAVHYYDEDNIKVTPVSGRAAVKTSASEKNPAKDKGKEEVRKVVKKAEKQLAHETSAVKSKTAKKTPSEKPQQKQIIQLELFNFDD